MNPLLKVCNLELEYATRNGAVRALDGVDLEIAPGTIVGIVGESGSGKSTLGLAVGRLLPSNLQRVAGDLSIRGRSVFACDRSALRRIRREILGFVFQNPMQALDPTKTVAAQLALAMDEGEASPTAIRAALVRVGLPDPDRVARSYPHELSGGMAQRVLIATAIARRPAILVADEPTASLDATVRDQVLATMVRLCRDLGMSMLLLSHELRMVARICDTIAVMYGGRIVEYGVAKDVFESPVHPYTKALLRAAPGEERQGETLDPIPGMPPVLRGKSPGCAFAPRCSAATPVCTSTRPPDWRSGDRAALCHHVSRDAA